jgi:glutathione S-transferase
MLLYVDSQYLSPYAMSAHVALREKGLSFHVQTLDLAAGGQRESGFAQASITRRVPTLVDEQFTLSESSAITEYLDEAYPGTRLYPHSLQARARARQIQAWLRSDLAALRQERSTDVVFCKPVDKPLSEAAQAAADKLLAGASRLLEHGGPWLFDAWSIADVDLALMLQRLLRNGDPVPAALQDYALRQWERPSVQEWARHARPAH